MWQKRLHFCRLGNRKIVKKIVFGQFLFLSFFVSFKQLKPPAKKFLGYATDTNIIIPQAK